MKLLQSNNHRQIVQLLILKFKKVTPKNNLFEKARILLVGHGELFFSSCENKLMMEQRISGYIDTLEDTINISAMLLP